MASGNLEDSVKGADYLSEVEVRQLALVDASDKQNAESGARWLLRIDAQIHLTERISGRRVTRAVSWSSGTYPLAAWTEKNSVLLSKVAAEGCEQLARRLLEAAENAWKGK